MLAIALAVTLMGVSPKSTRVAQPNPSPAPFAWPTPDLIEDADVQGPMRVQGIPIRLRAVKLRHSLDELAPLYLHAYEQAGFYIPPGEHQVDLFRDPSLTALDTRRFISYTAIFQKNPDGSTTVILGEANLSLYRPANVPPGFPMIAGAAHVSSVHFEGSQVLTYDAPAKPDAVRAFYAKALGKLGFAPGTAPLDANVFRKGANELQLELASGDTGRTSVVIVMRQPAAPSAPATGPSSAPAADPPR